MVKIVDCKSLNNATIHDILSKMEYGYNIVVKNTISGRIIDDFIYAKDYVGCGMDIKYLLYYPVEILSVNKTDPDCTLLEFNIFDYATVRDFKDYFFGKNDGIIYNILVLDDNNIINITDFDSRIDLDGMTIGTYQIIKKISKKKAERFNNPFSFESKYDIEYVMLIPKN